MVSLAEMNVDNFNHLLCFHVPWPMRTEDTEAVREQLRLLPEERILNK
jgi:hypothetical protein